MRAQFVLSEILVGLRRNLTMTVAVIVTVAISLALAGSGLLLRKQVNLMKGYWYDRVEVSIFLAENVTEAQRQSIQDDLQALPEVERVDYESKADAFVRFKEQFKDSPQLVENASEDALPESFRVKLKDPEKFDVVASAFAERAGVETVLNQRELLEKFFKVLNGLQLGTLAAAGLQLLAAAFLISNTIRVAAFSRRRETGIMRLVGASNLYIQLPFLLEGAFAGLIGVTLAVSLLAAFKVLLIDKLLRTSITATAFIGWDAVWAVVPVLLLLGVGLSAVASFVTLRKYLRV
ncbi:MAG TPA: permease-like cell division protein FtsX [Mycobacteriales bacterium]|nr:permease-like cell division protein FtsX [Mycobacteriales bacterium]